jgi:hypothetical protein
MSVRILLTRKKHKEKNCNKTKPAQQHNRRIIHKGQPSHQDNPGNQIAAGYQQKIRKHQNEFTVMCP